MYLLLQKAIRMLAALCLHLFVVAMFVPVTQGKPIFDLLFGGFGGYDGYGGYSRGGKLDSGESN